MSRTSTIKKPPSDLILPTDTCVQCGKTDSAPKLYYGRYEIVRYHHDCTPVPVLAEIIAGGHGVHPLVTAEIFKACQGGIRDDDLREYIQTHAEMQDFGDAEMLMAASFANDVLDATYNGSASGTVVIGSTTYTYPFKLKWLSTLSVAATAGTEWTGGSYPAGGVSLSGLFTVAASAQAKASTGAVTVTNSPALTWADNEQVDSTGTPKRMVFKGTPSLAISVTAASTCTVPSGSYTGAQT